MRIFSLPIAEIFELCDGKTRKTCGTQTILSVASKVFSVKKDLTL